MSDNTRNKEMKPHDDEKKEWVVAWRMKITGEEGRGTYPLTKLAAELAAESCNNLWHDTQHWAEQLTIHEP